MLKKQKAMSLMELLAVVAILGIITAFAYPAYRKYVVKANMTDLYIYGAGLTTLVTNEIIESGGAGGSGAISAEKGNFDLSNVQGFSHEKASSINVLDNGTIEIKTNPIIPGDQSIDFQLTPKKGKMKITWSCSIQDAELFEYVPKECHNVHSDNEDN